MSILTTSNNQKLVQDIKSIVAEAESILSASADEAGDGVGELTASLTAKLADAKDRLIELEESVVLRAKQAVKATDGYVHDNPWQSAIIAGGVGFLIGYLSASRQR